ncbi:hypothetical protein GFM07_34840 [Rhizobium leguminosarum bv. viciae]|nr:hypothetical protein [Rhizobium leguminosarum bv. viciae]
MSYSAEDQFSMIKPELAFAIILTSNLAAPILALVAGRRWPHCRKTLHFLAVIWVVLSSYVCDRMTFTPDITTVDDSYDDLDQFIAVVAILLQQLAILMTYVAWFACSAFVKRQRHLKKKKDATCNKHMPFRHVLASSCWPMVASRSARTPSRVPSVR